MGLKYEFKQFCRRAARKLIWRLVTRLDRLSNKLLAIRRKV